MFEEGYQHLSGHNGPDMGFSFHIKQYTMISLSQGCALAVEPLSHITPGRLFDLAGLEMASSSLQKIYDCMSTFQCNLILQFLSIRDTCASTFSCPKKLR